MLWLQRQDYLFRLDENGLQMVIKLWILTVCCFSLWLDIWNWSAMAHLIKMDRERCAEYPNRIKWYLDAMKWSHVLLRQEKVILWEIIPNLHLLYLRCLGTPESLNTFSDKIVHADQSCQKYFSESHISQEQSCSYVSLYEILGESVWYLLKEKDC